MEVFSSFLHHFIFVRDFQHHWRCKRIQLSCFVEVLKDALNVFSSLSGLQPNPSKAEMFCSGADEQHHQQLLEIMGCNVGRLQLIQTVFSSIQCYLKTGTCKFGATCKFHHPRDKAGIAGRVPLNILGYPLRLNETECAYYLRTGQCKFGSTCKYHHPQPSNMMVSLRGSPVYPTAQSPTTPSQQSYPGGITNWSFSRSSFIPSPHWQGLPGYSPLLLPQGMVSVPRWNACSGRLSSISASESHQQTAGSHIYGSVCQSGAVNVRSQGTYSPYHSGSAPVGYYALMRENIFPERPGQAECQFYMKTGDCKFGAVCRFHHPRERMIPAPDCVLSTIDLPLRPGEPLCVFDSRYGICKFGPSCKFDHPMGVFTYNLSASSSADIPAVRYLLGSSSGPGALSLSLERLVEASSATPRQHTLSETRQMPSGDNHVDTEG